MNTQTNIIEAIAEMIYSNMKITGDTGSPWITWRYVDPIREHYKLIAYCVTFIPLGVQIILYLSVFICILFILDSSMIF
jgi:hypothetical protein